MKTRAEPLRKVITSKLSFEIGENVQKVDIMQKTAKKTRKQVKNVENKAEQATEVKSDVVLVPAVKKSEKMTEELKERVVILRKAVSELPDVPTYEQAHKFLGHAYYVRNSAAKREKALENEQNPIITGS